MSHVAAIVVTYEDGSKTGQAVHFGDEASCRRVAEIVPAVAVSYPGAVAAHVVVLTEATWVAGGGEPRATEPGGTER